MNDLFRGLVLSLLVFISLSKSSDGQVNCPPSLPLTLNGNTEYCIGSNGVELSVPEIYDNYEWLPTTETGQTVLLTAGNYDLVVTHYTGCTDTLSFEVEQVSNPPQPTITANGPTEFCEGESVTLSGPEGYPYYEWSSGSVGRNITVYESGTFVLSIEDWLGCVSSSNSLQVTVDPYPTAAFSPSLNMFDVSFSNLSYDAVTYEWNFGDGTTSNDFEPTHTYSVEGNIDMYLVAENDCGTDTAFLNLISVSAGDLKELSDFQVYPNPSSGQFSVRLNSFEENTLQIEIHDLSGRQWYSQPHKTVIGHNQIEIDITGINSGVYVLEVYSQKGIVQSRIAITEAVQF